MVRQCKSGAGRIKLCGQKAVGRTSDQSVDEKLPAPLVVSDNALQNLWVFPRVWP